MRKERKFTPEQRKPWEKPRLVRLEAGAADSGIRAGPEFSTSS